MKSPLLMEERKSGEGKGGEYLENKTIFFLEKKKNREGKGRQCLEKEQHIKFQVVHKSDALFDFTQLTMCLM